MVLDRQLKNMRQSRSRQLSESKMCAHASARSVEPWICFMWIFVFTFLVGISDGS